MPAEDIDRLYWDDPYYLAPDGDMAVEAFTVIREAMDRAGKVALARVVMHQRERLLALEPRDRGILAYTLRTHDEVRDPKDIFGHIPHTRPDPAMIDIATGIIEQKEGPFDPSDFTDRYEDALRKLIAEKQKAHGRKVTAPEPREAEVIDLMEALKRSLGQAKGAKPAAKKAEPHKRKPAARKRAS